MTNVGLTFHYSRAEKSMFTLITHRTKLYHYNNASPALFCVELALTSQGVFVIIFFIKVYFIQFDTK